MIALKALLLNFLLVICFLINISHAAPSKVRKTAKKPVAQRTVVQKSSAGKVMRRGPASDPDAPIEVRGQSRNLNMMLILQNQNEVIDFIKLRKDYQVETKKMNY